jgi:nucleoside-diphosphate-sugar epimerase
MRVLIIGGTGGLSSRITERALEDGHRVLIYHRGQRGLRPGVTPEEIRADRAELLSRADEIARFDPEAIIDAICFSPAQARDLIAISGRARRVVLISTVDTYGEDIGGGPVTEERAPAPVTPYARAKLECEQLVQAALGARATVVRPGHIVGRGFLTTSLWGRTPYLIDRIRRGKAIPAIDGGRNLMTPVHALDAAEWILRCLDNPAVDGQIINTVGAEIIPQRRYYEAIARSLGVELELFAVPSPVFKRCFDQPSQFNWHRPYSCRKAVDRLDYTARATVESMLDETVQHMLAHGLVKNSDEQPFDDRLIDWLRRHETELEVLLRTRPA